MRELGILWIIALLICLLMSACGGVNECDTDMECMLRNPTIEPY